MDERLLLRIEEAAKACSLGRSKMYELVAAGEIPTVRIGRAVRIPVSALRDWVERETTSAADDQTLRRDRQFDDA